MKGYKTVLFSIIGMILGILEAIDWISIIPDSMERWLIPAIFAVVYYLRTITDGPVGDKVPTVASVTGRKKRKDK